MLSYLRGGAIGFEPVCLREISNVSLSELTQVLNYLHRVSQTGSGLGWLYQGSEMNQGALMRRSLPIWRSQYTLKWHLSVR